MGKWIKDEPILKVDIDIDKGKCIVWQGRIDRHGYGRKGGRLAHRVAFEEAGNVLIKGLELDHLCRNRACVNPEHLEQVTHRENQLRGDTIIARNISRTHCPRGHEYNDENTYYVVARNIRQCRKCNLISVKKYQLKTKVKQP